MGNTIEYQLYPLTLPQQAFYYDYLLIQNDSKYNMGGAFILNGELDIDLFRLAYKFANSKFDVFRQRFIAQDGELFQTFISENEIDIEYIDFRKEDNPLEKAMQFILVENAKPLPVENVCLYRESIIQTDDKQFILFPRFHHFSNDAYGFSIINRILSDTYNSLLNTGEYPDTKFFSYIDFIEDDLTYRSSDSYKESIDFWQEKLSILPEPMEFTQKKYNLKNASLQTEQVTLNLHRMCYDSIIRIADELCVTPFQTLLGILFTTLYKLYGKNNIIIGMPVLNRSNHKFRNTSGLFMNMIPVRLQLDENWVFADILNAIKLEVKESYRHQRLPLSETLKHFRGNPEFRNELFDVTIIYRKMDFSQLFGNAKLQSVTLDTHIREESLSLEIDEYDDEENVNLFFNYNPLVLSEQEILQLARCFETVLFELIYSPEKKISEVRILSAFEEHRILKTFNENGVVKKTNHTIVSKFEECAQLYSAKPAIIHNGIESSYSTINEISSKIAYCLHERHQVLKGDIICLAAERSADAISVMMAIMKTGAVYLPVDSQTPRERLTFILKNSDAKLLITDNPSFNDLDVPVFSMNEICDCSMGGNIPADIKQDDLAYVIYTSGSTGTPKGVMIEHGSFMTMFVNMINNYHVTEKDRVLQFASPGFDAAIFEVFQALLTGATLVITDRQIIQDPSSFIRHMNESKISVATLPPAYLNALDKPELPFLHTLITAGEPAILSDANFYSKNKRYINGYGPTEASVCASWFEADKDIEYKNSLPIGKTVPGSSIYILNEKLEPLPVGYEGELCIAGSNLARGYLNDKELTSRKFIPDPFEKNSLMYRTGDRARFLPDGNIEFLGRLDDQIKIKGNRIEMGEIENRLQKHSKVKEAVVLDLDICGNKELAAFIVLKEETSSEILKKFLLDFLPEYMIPLYFIFIEKVPLTQNGKINKNELREMVLLNNSTVTKDTEEPSSLELKLISLFEEVLNYSPVSVNDNFFSLGGESLKTARLITRIKKELQVEINFKTIFDHPSVRGVADAIAIKRDANEEVIEKAPDQEFYPLSHAQKRLWVLSHDKENTAIYNMPLSLLLEGNLDVAILEKAIAAVVKRHEILRSVFIEGDGEPSQKVLTGYTNSINVYDLSKEEHATEKARVAATREAMLPFNLSHEIPFRASIYKLSDKKHLLLIVIHHIAGDGLSIKIMMEELGKLYHVISHKEDKTGLEPLTFQYKDYCLHEIKILESEKIKLEKKYWLDTLYKPLPVLNLPTDRLRPAVKTYEGKYLFSEFSPVLSKRLRKLSKEQNTSLFTLLLAAVNILLHKYTASKDIVIGSPVAGRNLLELENQVGLYLNTVALRNQINSRQSFSSFLGDIKDKAAEAFSNSNYPFDRLINDLDLERDTSRTPLFDVLMQYQSKDVTVLNIEEVNATFFPIDFNFSKFDLTFTFMENDDQISFNICYNTDLFLHERIEKMTGHFHNILSMVLANPNITIEEISILDQNEINTLLKLSEGPKTISENKTVTSLFEEQVKKTPLQTAIVFNERKLTYHQLNQQANALAFEIQKHQIEPDDIIAILLPRSELFLIGIFSILKSGAAYLPLSPDLPSERIRFMLTDSRCKLLLTNEELLSQALQITPEKAAILNISSYYENEVEFVTPSISPSSLAYVIYTSGTTGTPKGVMIEHHSLCNLVSGLGDAVYANIKGSLNIAMVSPFVFDASIKQIFFALLNGHCLDIVPDDIRLDGRKLISYFESHRINVTDGTPVHLDILIDELQNNEGNHLPQRFVIGGQQLMQESIQRLFEISGARTPVITNVYGPTECCDVATCMEITSEFLTKYKNRFSALPVGKPLNNVQVYILDENLEMLPAGVNGEICISGEGLARAYLNRPELSRDKFVKAEFGHGKRIYRTGDIGHYLSDGTIQITGRNDDQVKLRGFRIELNEITCCLTKYREVTAATVILTGEGNQQELAAYFTSRGKIDPSDLRQFLSLHLPDYMIPTWLIELDEFPLTINGKVDKKALPVPVKETIDSIDDCNPRDILEQKLSEIWKDLLHINQVGRNDNFFHLGGHSLIAIRLVSRIHREFNIEINIWEVFQHASISSLSRLLKTKNSSLFNPIKNTEKKEFYPLSHAQRRMWVLSKLEGQSTMYNLPGALMLQGDLNIAIFEQAWNAVIQRHESLRTYIIESDGEPFQKIADHFDFTIEVNESTGSFDDKQVLSDLAMEYFDKEFDLSRLPLMGIKLVRFSPYQHLLLFNMHHIIGDGWSIEILLTEFKFFYNAILNHSDMTLEPLRIHYKDYAQWQNNVLEESALESSKSYWHKKLQKPRQQLNLPADYKHVNNMPNNGCLLHFSLGKEKTKKLTELGSNQNSSLFMTLLSAVYILLYKYTSEEDIMIGAPVAGRQHYDLENQVGFYINTLVLRNEIHADDSYLNLLERVNKTLTEAFDNQFYPFDRLVDELDVDRLQNRNPLFDVMVAWMVKDGMEMNFEFNGIHAEGIKFSITRSMFDLTFLFQEKDNEVLFSLEYNTSLFSKERIERMAQHFNQLVENIIHNPQEKISNLSILTDNEKEQLLIQFNAPSKSLPLEKNVIELFEEQLTIHPDNIALIYEDKKLTYFELGCLSNSIANLIIEKAKVKKEDIVVVIVEDPVLSVAAILGVMKTGAAYLPLASDTPIERLAFIINDSNAKAILFDGSTILPKLDIEVLDIKNASSTAIISAKAKIEASDLAYVIYTSGSTGVPKGVMVEHGALSNLISSLKKDIYWKYQEPINELMITSFAFDVSLKQIFASLNHGNCLHILNKEKRLDPREVTKYILNEKIHIADITPSVFAVMLEEGFGEVTKQELKELFLGSEALPYKLMQRFFQYPSNKNISVYNFYGPTECCVESSCFHFDPDKMNDDIDIALIGKPILNECIYILDQHLNLCPQGVPGEICIAGRGLARGYLNDQSLTSMKFVNFPLAGIRIYKTGDLGRIRFDGNIEYLGRIDEQVKIRGYRVELQEVEKHLRSLEGINECAVKILDGDRDNELAAYYTAKGPFDTSTLKIQLERYLPKYMIPTCFIQLEKIPLTSSGKVDKKALPHPTNLPDKKTYRPPADYAEASVLSIMSEILQKEKLSMDDNFFEIGGNSLNAVRFISRVQKDLNVNLPLREIFFSPVLLQVAETVRKLMATKDIKIETMETSNTIIPASDEELIVLSKLQFDDED